MAQSEVVDMTDRELCAVFAKNLTDIMHDKGIKQADIVRQLHVAKATVSGWCSGLNIPRTDALSKLLQMLDANPSDLLAKKDLANPKIDEARAWAIAAIDQMSDEDFAAVAPLLRRFEDKTRDK